MAVVSKYLDEAIVKCEKLGLSKHALSRGIVTIAIGAYVAHISYPFVTKLIKAANLSPTALGHCETSASTSDDDDDETDSDFDYDDTDESETALGCANANSNGTTNSNKIKRNNNEPTQQDNEDNLDNDETACGAEGETDLSVGDRLNIPKGKRKRKHSKVIKQQIKQAEKFLAKATQERKKSEQVGNLSFSQLEERRIGLNLEFLFKLKRLIHIMIPRLWCREIGLLGVHTTCLISRTFLSIYVAAVEGAIVKFIVKRDLRQFIIGLLKWFSIAIPATFINSMIRYLENKLALSFRTRLVNHSYKLYFRNQTYYRVANLDGRIENADHRHCEEYSVLAFSFFWKTNNNKTPFLQLSSHRGLCAHIYISVLKRIPDDLKALLEDVNVLKVGVDASVIASKLKSFNVITSRIFDIRYLVQTKLTSSKLNYSSASVVIKLFKQFAKEETDSSITASTQQALHKFIEDKCQPHIDKIYRKNEYPKPQAVLHKPVVYVISDAEKCLDITEKIREHCQETKVLGLNCQYNGKTVTLLQLATYPGLCVLIQLNRIKKIPMEFQDILNDKNILKVGMHISKDVVRLKGDYDIHVVSTLDLRYLAKECKSLERNVDLNQLSEVHLNVNIHPDDWRSLVIDWRSASISEIEIEHTANYVFVTIELFKVFEKKLVEEKFFGDGKKFINEFCVANLNENYPKQKSQTVSIDQNWLSLPEQDICLVNTVEECQNVVRRLKKHCDEYNVVGFDCEWVPRGGHKVALLQLATHRGLCALIRLCKLETVPYELNEFLNDPFILKVGIGTFKDAVKVSKDYHLDISGTLDLKILSKKCKISSSGLGGLSQSVLHVKLDGKIRGRMASIFHKRWETNTLDEEHIKYAANDAHVSIELFKKFQEKLMKENRSGDLAQDVQQFLEDHCKKYVKDTNRRV